MQDAVRRLAQTAAVSLPLRPKLAHWLRQIDLGDGRLQFHAADFSFTLSPQLWITAFRAVEPVLDGVHPVEEVIRCGSAQVPEPLAVLMIKLLFQNNIIYENAYDVDDERSEEASELVEALSRLTSYPRRILSRTQRCNVILVGDIVQTTALKAELQLRGFARVRELDLTGSKSSQLEAELGVLTREPSGTLVVAFATAETSAELHHVNGTCLRHSVRWMRVVINSDVSYIGPTFVPFQTGCLLCYETRLVANGTDRRILSELAQSAFEQPICDPDLWRHVHAVPIGYAVAEIQRLASGIAPPATYSRYLVVTHNEPYVAGHDFLRVPRCNECGRGTFLRQLWADPEVK